ncbi:hypothetical protein A0H76_1300 [Hepatospora eriocheir]|uniref:Uncharacterized protein n=1 Tax=Hepatospora eriocheir TaxID=1081669 RepID=A0A1X0QCV6_9MICR|nr:hypothetical protein HERIO_501 [Hepatospora eriocheir]ORD99162.1 hypothetical protein A0H76_1300 [Hepatospora eriocheir]
MEENKLDKCLKNLQKYLANTEYEQRLKEFIELKMNDPNSNDDNVLESALNYFDEIVPNQIKTQLYNDINREF